MAKDLTILLEDRPGAVAKLAEALARAGISIEGWCGSTCEGKGVIHILVDDSGAAQRALEASQITVSEVRDVLVLDVEDRAGVFAEIAGRIGRSGVNVDFGYLATRTRLVIGARDIKAARDAVAGLTATR